MDNIKENELQFILLEKIINDLELKKKVGYVFNCCKSMVAKGRHNGKFIVSWKTNQTCSESKWTKDHVTVNVCVSANGLVLLQQIIFIRTFPSVPFATERPEAIILNIR